MMLKRIVTISLILLVVAAFTGCKTNTEESSIYQKGHLETSTEDTPVNPKTEQGKTEKNDVIKYEDCDVLSYVKDPSAFSYDASQFELTISNGYESGDISGTKNNLYYTLQKPVPMDQMALATTIYHIDTETGNSEQVFHTSAEVHWLNELIAADNVLFWVMRDASGKRIERYDLEDGALSTVKEFSLLSPPVLITGGQEYLTWYEHDEENEDNISLYAYVVEEEKIFLVSDQIAGQSYYTRAHVNDRITAFAEMRNGDTYMCLYDLHEQEYLRALRTNDASHHITSLQANSDYMVWAIIKEGYYSNAILYAYDLANDKLRCITNPKDNIALFSHHLLKDTIIINNSRSNQIIGRLLSEGKETVVSKELPGKPYYFFGRVFDERNFIVYEYVGDRQFILLIRQQ